MHLTDLFLSLATAKAEESKAFFLVGLLIHTSGFDLMSWSPPLAELALCIFCQTPKKRHSRGLSPTWKRVPFRQATEACLNDTRRHLYLKSKCLLHSRGNSGVSCLSCNDSLPADKPILLTWMPENEGLFSFFIVSETGQKADHFTHSAAGYGWL